jgi:carboxypeptidase C (cathepsin A)
MRRGRASAGSRARTRRRRSIGIDEDVYAFADFIKQFLSKYQRWNSPRYLFGES